LLFINIKELMRKQRLTLCFIKRVSFDWYLTAQPNF
jgi:hypothetical protein